MITVEEKLEIFHRIVYRDEEEKYLKALKELEEYNQQLLENKKEEMKRQRDEIIRRKITQAKVERNELKSEGLEDTKAKLRQKRKELETDLVDSIVERANEFVKSKGYGEYLCRNLDKYLVEFEEDEVVLILRDEDRLISESCLMKLKDQTGKTFIVETLPDEKIGGFMMSNKDRTFNIDHTLKTLIQEKEYMIGKRLNDALGEVGEING
ncbi:MAG TPA: V-type ATP synthase subunit E family protein [Tissierellaceae bacterium]|jgi:vacuolar-type H+-ATPase subunit E/Vma4|nr:V-type ATP synthase subunit E family protein [Tissierellaceae bacterium]